MITSNNNLEKLFNIIATNVKTGEEVIEKYDFSAMDAQTWVHNNAKNQPSCTFTIEPASENE
jgi:t-SNARE complex subunit (syntaxin)